MAAEVLDVLGVVGVVGMVSGGIKRRVEGLVILVSNSC